MHQSLALAHIAHAHTLSFATAQSLVVGKVVSFAAIAPLIAAGAGQTTTDLLGTQETDDGRLALARDLVMRGGVLFTRHGDVWEPKAAADLAAPEAVTRHLALLALGPGAAVAYRDGRQAVLSGRGRWGQVEVVFDDGTRVWWQDKDVRAVGSSAPERATGDGADDAVVVTAAGVDDDERTG